MNDHVKIPAKSRNPYYQGPVSDHFDGTHFFNPVRYLRLLEVVTGPEVQDRDLLLQLGWDLEER